MGNTHQLKFCIFPALTHEESYSFFLRIDFDFHPWIFFRLDMENIL